MVTGATVPAELAGPRRGPDTAPGGMRPWHAPLEIALIFLLFFLLAGWLPPDVNEAHYLSKARHYWNPDWCARDVFLESADAHVVFYWTFGWLTCWLSLPATAWVGRLLTWLLLAWAWRRLSVAVIPRPWVAGFTAAMFVPLQYGAQMAGEWVVGGVEAKGLAYVLVFLGLEALVRGRWRWCWVAFGAAAAFHVLVGGWSVVAGLLAWLLGGRAQAPLRRILPGLVLGGLLSLPGLLPTLALNAGLDSETIAQANRIYVHGRLAHHLVFTEFAPWQLLAHLGLLALWSGTAWLQRRDAGQRRLHLFVAGAVMIAGVGVLWSLSPRVPLTTALLRFYWFRLSDAVVPLGAALGMAATIIGWRESSRARLGTALLAAALVLSSVFFVTHFLRQARDPRPPAVKQIRPARLLEPHERRLVYEDWVRLGQWIHDNTPSTAVFVTPRAQQTFHWYAQRAEVACWKDVPQDAESMVAWWERMRTLYPPEVVQQGLVAHGERRLRELAARYGAEYVILDRTVSRRPLGLERIYPTPAHPNRFFEVYRVVHGDDSSG